MLLAEGNEICYAGVFIVLEVKSENLVDRVARFKGFGIYRENARVGRTELGVEIDTDRNALDLADALGKFLKLFIEVGIILRFSKLAYSLIKCFKGAA